LKKSGEGARWLQGEKSNERKNSYEKTARGRTRTGRAKVLLEKMKLYQKKERIATSFQWKRPISDIEWGFIRGERKKK